MGPFGVRRAEFWAKKKGRLVRPAFEKKLGQLQPVVAPQFRHL